MLEILGKFFGRLQVLHRLGSYHRCVCACGTEVTVRTDRLTSGKTRSCGCLAEELREAAAAAAWQRREGKRLARKGAAEAKREHHRLTRRLRAVWNAMMQRCHNVNNRDFKYYGGRGITVCPAWHDIDRFLDDMLPRYKRGQWLERRDNDKGYSPGNCVFTTPWRQGRNRSNTLKLADGTPLTYLVRRYKTGYQRAYRWYSQTVATGQMPTTEEFAKHFSLT